MSLFISKQDVVNATTVVKIVKQLEEVTKNETNIKTYVDVGLAVDVIVNVAASQSNNTQVNFLQNCIFRYGEFDFSIFIIFTYNYRLTKQLFLEQFKFYQNFFYKFSLFSADNSFNEELVKLFVNNENHQ